MHVFKKLFYQFLIEELNFQYTLISKQLSTWYPLSHVSEQLLTEWEKAEIFKGNSKV